MSRLCPRPAPAPAGIVRPPSETTAMVAASLSPRRGELFEFAVHGAPRSLHRVDSRREPSERCNQPRNVDPRRAPDGAIHIHFRIRNTSQSLYVHEAPPGVTALEILRQPLPPAAAKSQVSCHKASFCLIHSIFARTDFYCACTNHSSRCVLVLQHTMRCDDTWHRRNAEAIAIAATGCSLVQRREEFRNRRRSSIPVPPRRKHGPHRAAYGCARRGCAP